MMSDTTDRMRDAILGPEGWEPGGDRKRDAGYQKARAAVWERADGLCEAACTIQCARRGQQVHHIAGRTGSDPHRLDNLLLVCGHCHDYIHDRPGEAYVNGWMRRRNGTTPEPTR